MYTPMKLESISPRKSPPPLRSVDEPAFRRKKDVKETHTHVHNNNNGQTRARRWMVLDNRRAAAVHTRVVRQKERERERERERDRHRETATVHTKPRRHAATHTLLPFLCFSSWWLT